MTNKSEPILFLSDARGVYIPRDFATSVKRNCVTGISEEDYKILEAGPEHEAYWDAWDEVCRDAVITDEHGVKYYIHQDGDCWLIPQGMEWNERTEGYDWPEDIEDEDEDEVIEPEDQDQCSDGSDIPPYSSGDEIDRAVEQTYITQLHRDRHRAEVRALIEQERKDNPKAINPLLDLILDILTKRHYIQTSTNGVSLPMGAYKTVTEALANVPADTQVVTVVVDNKQVAAAILALAGAEAPGGVQTVGALREALSASQQ